MGVEKDLAISLIMPLYNSEKYVSAAIESIIKQDYSNWELLIVDDGSRDNSLQIAARYQSDRIKVLSQKNKGASAARNNGYLQSNGDYILFFDSDDLIPPNYLSAHLSAIDGSSVTLAQWGRFIGDDLSSFRLVPNPSDMHDLKAWVGDYWYHVNPMTNPGRLLIPRQLIDKAGLWNESLSLYDDMEFFTRIFKHSDKILFNDKTTFYYRSGIQGLSATKGEDAFISMFNSIDLSVKYVLDTYQDTHTKKSCANFWQLFIYEAYPFCKELRIRAEENIRTLGGADLKFPSGGLTKFLLNFMHWKMIKSSKLAIYRLPLHFVC